MGASLPPPIIPGGFLRPSNVGLSLVPDGITVQGKMTFSFGTCTSGSIAGSVLTTTGSPAAGNLSGVFAVGQMVYAAGVSTGVTILSIATGTGAAGTYNLSGSPSAVSGVAIRASTANIGLTNASFTNADVGKSIRLQGLGLNGADLISTIAAVVDATTITLASPPLSSLPFGLSGGIAFVIVNYGTDNSAAVLAAHDAAVVKGHRDVFIDPGVYWIGNLFGAAQVIYVGQNATFIGNRRYRVQSPTRRFPHSTRGGLNPSVHLAKFQAQTAPRVAFVGDSIGTPNFFNNASVYLAAEINKELRRAYPTKTIGFMDFAIGGCTMSDFASASAPDFAGRSLTQPYWWSVGHSWMYQIQNLTAWGAATPPHTVFLELGTNQATAGAEVAAIYSVITQLRALSTAPDIILFTPGTTSQMGGSSWWGDSQQESRENIGAYWRGFAHRNGLGYIDIGRHVRMLRDGIDVIPEDVPSNTTVGLISSMTLPVAFPMCRDFAINWNMNFSNAQWIATTTSLNIKIGESIPLGFPTLFQIGRTAGGNFAVSLSQGGVSGVVFGPIDTGVAVPTSGTIFFEFVIRDSSVRLAANSSNFGAVGLMPSIWEGEVERLRSPFTPVMYYSNNVATTIATTQVCTSIERPVMPNMVDGDLFGLSAPSVHPSTDGQIQLYRQALENERFI